MPELICNTSVMQSLHQLGLLVDAKQRGLIPAVAPLLDELERHNFHMSPRIRAAILKAVGEPPK